MKTKPKKRNPTDSTMRNVRAVNERFRVHDLHIKGILLAMLDVQTRLEKLERLK